MAEREGETPIVPKLLSVNKLQRQHLVHVLQPESRPMYDVSCHGKPLLLFIEKAIAAAKGRFMATL